MWSNISNYSIINRKYYLFFQMSVQFANQASKHCGTSFSHTSEVAGHVQISAGSAKTITSSWYEVQTSQMIESLKRSRSNTIILPLCKKRGLCTTRWLLPAERHVLTLSCLWDPPHQQARRSGCITVLILHSRYYLSHIIYFTLLNVPWRAIWFAADTHGKRYCTIKCMENK